ncbi:hypothetical protein D3C79_1062470 [compost metagenome]
MQHAVRQLEQHLPGGSVGDGGERVGNAQQAACHGLVQHLAELGAVTAVARQQAGGADYADLALAIEQFLATVQA